jgi:hypothetical protein
MPEVSDHLGFTLETGELIRVLLKQASHDFNGDSPKSLMRSDVDFCHPPPGYKFVDVNLSERFSCPVCHT